MSDWANLPTDIMILVTQRLQHMEDFISMAAVCKPWQSLKKFMPSLPPRTPFLLLRDSDKTKPPKLYTPLTMNKFALELPEAAWRSRFLGTCRGWLLTANQNDLQIYLLHPFSRRTIALPNLFVVKNQFKYANKKVHSHGVKLAMSSNPLHEKEDCIVLAIARRRPVLTFSRIGDKSWTCMVPHNKSYLDVVYFKGMFYAVDAHGVLFICHIYNNNENVSKAITAPLPRTRGFCYQMYLVESSGDLLLVSRSYDWSYDTSYTYLSVYKLEEEHTRGVVGYPYKWKEVENLRGRALFVGRNASVSVRPSKNVKPDCVYISGDDSHGSRFYLCKNMYTGVYNTVNKTIEPCQFKDLRFPVWYF